MPAIEIRDLPELTIAYVKHTGPYLQIPSAFGKLCSWAGPQGIFGPQTRLIGVFYDDPDTTPPEMLRSEAGLTVPPGTKVAGEVELRTLPGGKHAVVTYRGPYSEMAPVYRWLYGEWLTNNRQHARALPSYEIYLNDPSTTAAEELLTEICLPLE